MLFSSAMFHDPQNSKLR